MTNPAGVGEPDTNSVLWRRHERATDNIWFPGALISFRSAFVGAVAASANFPVIADPNPPAAMGGTGPGVEGDIQVSGSELLDARASCLAAWDALELMFGVNMEGPVAINFRQFVTSTGAPSSTIGRASFQVRPSGAGPCTNPIIANDGDGAFAAVRDNSFDLPGDAHDHLLAHEVGHTLFLGHGNGLDDDGDGAFDGCDGDLPVPDPSPPNEVITAAPPSLMTSGGTSDVVTSAQKGTVAAGTPGKTAGARGVANVTSGTQLDPPGQLIDVKVRSDHRVDRVHDVTNAGIDIVSSGIVTNEDLNASVFTHTLFGTLPSRGRLEYLLFVDLDDNEATGGTPATLGFPTEFEGAELVTSVTVDAGERQRLTPKAWRFRNGAFAEVPASSLKGDIRRSVDADTRETLFDSVSIQMPAQEAGVPADRAKMQSIARSIGGGRPEADYLPDDKKQARPFFLRPPRYPTAVITPARVRPGATVKIHVRGLIRGKKAKIFLGDERLTSPPIDSRGRVITEVKVPDDAGEGPRLVTVGVEGTALSADALLVVDKRAPRQEVPKPDRGPQWYVIALIAIGVAGLLLVAILALRRRRTT